MASKELSVDVAELRRLVEYRPESGEFIRLVRTSNRVKVGQSAASLRSDGYVTVSLFGQKFEAGRLAWLYMTGEAPKGEVDHRDTNPSNNRWPNLRDVTHLANMQNRRTARKGSQTGVLGVTKSPWRDGWFQARITVRRRCKYIGDFPTKEEAHAAYVNAKRELHEGNTL